MQTFHAFFVGMLLCLTGNLTAQTNSNGSEQPSTESPYDIRQRAQDEESGLLKLGINQLGWSKNPGSPTELYMGFQLAYERKLNTSFSFQGGVSWGFQNTNNRFHNYGVQLSSRYYYRMKRNVRIEKQADNLHGSYFSLQVQGNHSRALKPEVFRRFYNTAGVSLLWGRQMHLGKHWFFDVNVGMRSWVWGRSNGSSTYYFSPRPRLVTNFAIGFRL